MSREQILAMPDKQILEFVEQLPINSASYDPDAPVERRIGQWLTSPISEGGE